MLEILKSLAQWGIAGILVAGLLWLVWHRETVSGPRMMDKFGEQMDKARGAFAEQMDKARQCFFDTNKAERESCEKRHIELLAAMEEGFKEQRHATRDLAQAAGIREAYREALAKRPPEEKT